MSWCVYVFMGVCVVWVYVFMDLWVYGFYACVYGFMSVWDDGFLGVCVHACCAVTTLLSAGRSEVSIVADLRLVVPVSLLVNSSPQAVASGFCPKPARTRGGRAGDLGSWGPHEAAGTAEKASAAAVAALKVSQSSVR